jgi:hypothetical protein
MGEAHSVDYAAPLWGAPPAPDDLRLRQDDSPLGLEAKVEGGQGAESLGEFHRGPAFTEGTGPAHPLDGRRGCLRSVQEGQMNGKPRKSSSALLFGHRGSSRNMAGYVDPDEIRKANL